MARGDHINLSFQLTGAIAVGSGESIALEYLNQLIWVKGKHEFWRRIIRYNLRGAHPLSPVNQLVHWHLHSAEEETLFVLGSEHTLHLAGQYYKLSEYCLLAGTWTDLFLKLHSYVIKVIYARILFKNHVVLED